MTASLEVVTVEPAADQLRHTFGGGEPLVTVAPGTVVELTTEDCFGGRVRGSTTCPAGSGVPVPEPGHRPDRRRGRRAR